MKKLKIALTGNPNCGKTALFNALTNSKQHVGNWPGVTVEKKTGEFELNGNNIEVIDLPGIYSLNPYSLDEQVSIDFLTNEKPDLIVAIIDASNLERNLYLISQLLEMNNRVLICLNMMDIAKQKGIKINIYNLSNILKVPVVTTIANQKKGIDNLKKEIWKAFSNKKIKLSIDYGEELEKTLLDISNKVSIPKSFCKKFFILSVLEGDNYHLNLLSSPDKKKISELINSVNKRFDNDIEGYIVEKRYAYINSLTKHCSKKIIDIKTKMDFTEKIDKFILNRFLGIPLFIGIMWMTFQLVFTIGNPVSDIFSKIISNFSDILKIYLSGKISPFLISFIIDGVINGVGSIIVFVPILFILFMAISILEDSGYMSRAAFIMDRFMHVLGLHGKSFIPMILGFGCSIPGIMSCRTFENQKDRIITILIVPFMSCSARLPIYTLFAGVFFNDHAGTVIFSLYFIGIIIAVIIAKIFKNIFFKEEVSPLIMELPPYHIPQWMAIFKFSAHRSGLFLKKAGTYILGGVIIVWVLASFPFGVEYASKSSYIGQLGSFFAPIFKPAGFGNWQSTVALGFGVLAKEIVVGTFGSLLTSDNMSLNKAISVLFTPLSAYSFMIMTLIYFPCIATIGAIKQEIGAKWAIFSMIYTSFLGWLLAVIIYQLGVLLGF